MAVVFWRRWISDLEQLCDRGFEAAEPEKSDQALNHGRGTVKGTGNARRAETKTQE
jgi:hypothetical protein